MLGSEKFFDLAMPLDSNGITSLYTFDLNSFASSIPYLEELSINSFKVPFDFKAEPENISHSKPAYSSDNTLVFISKNVSVLPLLPIPLVESTG